MERANSSLTNINQKSFDFYCSTLCYWLVVCNMLCLFFFYVVSNYSKRRRDGCTHTLHHNSFMQLWLCGLRLKQYIPSLRCLGRCTHRQTHRQGVLHRTKGIFEIWASPYWLNSFLYFGTTIHLLVCQCCYMLLLCFTVGPSGISHEIFCLTGPWPESVEPRSGYLPTS